MNIKGCVIFVFLFLGLVTLYGCSDSTVTEESLSQLKECFGRGVVEIDSELVGNPDTLKCEQLKKDIAGLSQRNSQSYSGPFLYFLLLVLTGGVIGGAMNGITGPAKGKNVKGSNEDREIGLGMPKTIFVGIGASIVGVTFLGSFVHLKYEMIAPLEPGGMVPIPDFIETSITIVGLAIISGFLGVRLVQKVADGLLNEKLDKIERRSSDNLKEIINSLNERTMDLDNMAKFRELLHNGWYSILKGCDFLEAGPEDKRKHEGEGYIREGVLLLEEAIVLDEKSAKAYTWLAYGYKRLEQMPKALEFIKVAIQLEPTAKRYYNEACYSALLKMPVEVVIESLRMVDKLVDEKDVITFDSFSDEIRNSDPDFESIRGEAAFKEFVSTSKFK